MMKKIILCMFCCLCIITGCDGDKQILVDEEAVYTYLEEQYPEETFAIIKKEEIDLTNSTCGDDTVIGNSWLVQSHDTGITFKVEDAYRFNSFVCEFGTDDDYIATALKLKAEQNDNDTLHYDYIAIEVYEKEFSDAEEMVDVLYHTIYDMKRELPFLYEDTHLYIRIYTNDSDTCITLNFEKITSKDYIMEFVNKKKNAQ